MDVSRDDLLRAVAYAVRAPSVHNTQPWRWLLGPDVVELYADRDRRLPITDPDGRDLLLSCGAALHHLVVTLAGHGIGATVHRLPDPDDSSHLATIRTAAHHGDGIDASLAAMIGRRRTDRRPMSPDPVGPGVLHALAYQAARKGATLVLMRDEAQVRRLLGNLAEAADRQRHEPGYAAELRQWTHRYHAARDGIPAASIAVPSGAGPLRRFPSAQQDRAPRTRYALDAQDGAALTVITTKGDTPVDRLQAGEAASAVLLAATRFGLATTPLSQALEVESARRSLARDVLRVPEVPQLVIRVGWPVAGAAELPPTPRRALHDVVMPNLQHRTA
ncbi:Acg family FMN-binding oxidoreductase [Pseudonocardia sp. GCM10023141]|uniref:Acg family FMN-binding oxidoreductase n=1 Tax=Pseudonocardia sp. GCM10023141 TaxID=3252653 RepID=UPI003614246E